MSKRHRVEGNASALTPGKRHSAHGAAGFAPQPAASPRTRGSLLTALLDDASAAALLEYLDAPTSCTLIAAEASGMGRAAVVAAAQRAQSDRFARGGAALLAAFSHGARYTAFDMPTDVRVYVELLEDDQVDDQGHTLSLRTAWEATRHGLELRGVLCHAAWIAPPAVTLEPATLICASHYVGAYLGAVLTSPEAPLPHQANDLFIFDSVDYPTRPSLVELDRRLVFPDADDSQPYRIDIHIYVSAFAALESLQDRPGAVPRLRTVFVDLLKYTHVDTI